MRKSFVSFVFLAMPFFASAQTYYYDKNWKGVEHEDFAEYKRVLSPSSDSLHYGNKYRDSTLQVRNKVKVNISQ